MPLQLHLRPLWWLFFIRSCKSQFLFGIWTLLHTVIKRKILPRIQAGYLHVTRAMQQIFISFLFYLDNLYLFVSQSLKSSYIAAQKIRDKTCWYLFSMNCDAHSYTISHDGAVIYRRQTDRQTHTYTHNTPATVWFSRFQFQNNVSSPSATSHMPPNHIKCSIDAFIVSQLVHQLSIDIRQQSGSRTKWRRSFCFFFLHRKLRSEHAPLIKRPPDRFRALPATDVTNERQTGGRTVCQSQLTIFESRIKAMWFTCQDYNHSSWKQQPTVYWITHRPTDECRSVDDVADVKYPKK